MQMDGCFPGIFVQGWFMSPRPPCLPPATTTRLCLAPLFPFQNASVYKSRYNRPLGPQFLWGLVCPRSIAHLVFPFISKINPINSPSLDMHETLSARLPNNKME